MISPIEISALVLGIPSLIASLLSQVSLWQRKEYRLDRLSASLSEPAFRLRLLPYFLALAALLLDQALISIIIFFAYHAWRISTRGLFRPTSTTKANLIIILSVILLVLYSAASLSQALLLLPIFVALSVFLINQLGTVRKQQIISRAKALRTSLSNLKVIGITGSYGKTSTKHFLAQLMPDAIVSQEHRNDLFPIAQDMLAQLKPDTETYIVELGAYKIGEIAALAQLTQPTIGVLTAIGNQHLATFGSQENIVKAKWELVEALPKHGVAVLNMDDKNIKRVARLGGPPASARSEARTSDGGKGETGPAPQQVWFSQQDSSDIFTDQIKINSTTINCNLHIKDQSQPVTIPLAGEGALSSVLAAVAAAHAAGTSAEDTFSRVQQLMPFAKTMQIKSGPKESTILDDSYSANEVGVITAIKHLDTFSSNDKRIIMVPLIELGSEAAAVHKRISQALTESNAQVFIYGTAYKAELQSAFPENPPEFFTNPQALIKQSTKDISSDTVFLLEGRLPDLVHQTLTSK